jgi:hypothetical protein
MVDKAPAAAAALIVALAWLAPARAQPVDKQGSLAQNQYQSSPQNQRQPVQATPAPSPAPSGKSQLAPFNPNRKSQPGPAPAAGNPSPAAAKAAPPGNGDNLSADKLGDALQLTQNYLERRWLLLRLRVLGQSMPAADLDATLKADAQRLGVKGPSQAEQAQLDTELMAAINGFLDGIENRIRNEEAQWPSDKPPLQYANASLIGLEAARLEAEGARKNKGDALSALRRANAIDNYTKGGRKEDLFAGRDEAVDAAMQTVRPATPTAARR